MNTATTREIETAEAIEALSIIDTNILKDFLYRNAFENIGKRPNGEATTLQEEVGEVAKLAHRAYVADGVNYYRSRNAYAIAELSYEEREAASRRNYERAAKKLLFLSSRCKEIEGQGFVRKFIMMDDITDVIALVDAFEWCVRHYSEF